MKQLKLKQIELYGWNYPIRPERAEALSPGHRPGLSYLQTWRPVRAKALKLTRKFIKLLPLQGALLTVTIPRAMPWAKSFCPFRACWLYPLPWAKSFCPFRACGAKLTKFWWCKVTYYRNFSQESTWKSRKTYFCLCNLLIIKSRFS